MSHFSKVRQFFSKFLRFHSYLKVSHSFKANSKLAILIAAIWQAIKVVQCVLCDVFISRQIGVVNYFFKILYRTKIDVFVHYSCICPLFNTQCVKRMFCDLCMGQLALKYYFIVQFSVIFSYVNTVDIAWPVSRMHLLKNNQASMKVLYRLTFFRLELATSCITINDQFFDCVFI